MSVVVVLYEASMPGGGCGAKVVDDLYLSKRTLNFAAKPTTKNDSGIVHPNIDLP